MNASPLLGLVIAFAPLGNLAADVQHHGFDRAVSAVLPRVVKLYGLRGGAEAGFGSGIVVSEDGLVLTVLSLLIESRRIRAITSDGLLLGADVIHRDRERQMALLQLRPIDEDDTNHPDVGAVHKYSQLPEGHRIQLPYFDLEVEAELRPGDWVIAAGNAFKVAEGAEPVSLVHGIFSTRTRLDARRRARDFVYRGDVLVVDAITSNPGAPGGAMVNLDGQIVGMIGREVISNRTHTHFNYAIPRDVLQEYLSDVTSLEADKAAGSESAHTATKDELSEMQWKRRLADAGIRMSKVGYKRVLPLVTRVRLGSPASQAGIRKDDLILAVNGRSVADMDAFAKTISFLAPDEPWDFVISRGKQLISVRVEHAGPVDSTTPVSGEGD